MKSVLFQLFEHYPHLAVFISLVCSIVVAIAGILPSFFITAANILFFGFWPGTLLSFLGEAIGAAVSFILYRKGFKQASRKRLERFVSAKQLVEAGNKEAFLLVLSMRLLPFVPSGLITFAAAIGQISFIGFLLASSIGKIPALLMEAYSIKEVLRLGWQGKLILSVFGLLLVYFIIKKLYRDKTDAKTAAR